MNLKKDLAQGLGTGILIFDHHTKTTVRIGWSIAVPVGTSKTESK